MKLFVKPKEGLTVIHPQRNRPIKAEGEMINECSQVKRYLKYGDLITVKQSKKKTITKGDK